MANLNEMYNRIEDLCKSQGINMTQMCKEAGIPRGNLTDLKNGRTAILSTKNLGKISNYFQVSMDYLLGNEQKKEPTTKSDELDLQLEGIDFALFGEVKEMTDEQKQDVLDYIKFKKSQQKRE